MAREVGDRKSSGPFNSNPTSVHDTSPTSAAARELGDRKSGEGGGGQEEFWSFQLLPYPST